jgi:4-hydroxythreonine-4-phosphate dehydrogenase
MDNSSQPTRLLIITLGDPHSINVYAVNHLLRKAERDLPILVIGSYWQWQHQVAALNLPQLPFTHIKEIPAAAKPGFYFWDILPDFPRLPADELSAAQKGMLAVAPLHALKTLSLQQFKPAVLTCPIDKHSCSLAGFSYPGHTEYFCDEWGGGQGIMVLAGGRLRVGLVTNHVAVKDLSGQLTFDLVTAKIDLFITTLREHLGFAFPRVAVCGFNPHCSDNGLFGDEEQRMITPAVEAAQTRYGATAFIKGPEPADTVFYRAFHGEYDAVLAMYHDQGLGPLKTVHFDSAVNLTGGLRLFRVSPDHGPARDLYLSDGKVSLESFNMAYSYCRRALRLPS